MENKNFENLIHGFDTVQCAYFLESTKKKGFDFELLIRGKKGIKQTRINEPNRISLRNYNFLLHRFWSLDRFFDALKTSLGRISPGEIIQKTSDTSSFDGVF